MKTSTLSGPSGSTPGFSSRSSSQAAMAPPPRCRRTMFSGISSTRDWRALRSRCRSLAVSGMGPSLRGPIVSEQLAVNEGRHGFAGAARAVGGMGAISGPPSLLSGEDLADGLGEGVERDGLADDGVHGGRLLAPDVHEIAEAGQHDDRLVGRQLLDRGGELVAAHLRHRAVGEDEVEAAGHELVETLQAVDGALHG